MSGLRCIAATRVTFGISVSQQAPSEFLNSNGRSVLAGLQFFVQSANTWNITIVNKTDPLTFAIKALEDYGNSTVVRQNYQTLVNDPEINFFIGPVSSPLSAAAKAITEPAGKLLLGTKVGSASFYTGAEFSFSVTSSPPRYATTTFPEFRVNGIRRIMLVVEQTPFQIDIAKGFVANADDFSMEVVGQYNVITDTLNGIDDKFIQNITDTVALIRNFESDVLHGRIDAVVITSFTNVGRYFLEAAKMINYMPKAIYISSFYLPDFQALDPSLTAFVCGCDVIAPGINFRGDYFGTYDEFLAGFDATMPAYLGPANANHAIGAVSGLLLMHSIMAADSLDNNEVTRALGRFNDDTFFGPFQFGADHSQLRFIPIMQFVPDKESYQRFATSAAPDFTNSINVVGPSRVALQNLIFPVPTWDERIFNPRYVTAEYTIMGITAVAQALSVVCLILTVMFRKHRVIKASSPLFLIYILAGTMLSYSTNYTWTATQFNNASCVLTPLVLGLGFVITFGALFAKSWRIVTLFRQAEKLTVVTISNKKLTVILSVLVGVQAALSVVLAVFSELVVEATDPYRPALWAQRCSLGFGGLLYANIAFAGLIILTGLVLAVMMRKIKNQLFNEARHLAFIIYAIAVFVAVVTALSFDVLTGVNQYIFRSVAILVINLTTVITLFGTKLNYIRTGKLPTSEDPTALHRYIPSPRDREDADLRTTVQALTTRVEELNRLLASTKSDYESLKNSVTNDPNVRQSRVALVQGKEDDSAENSSSSSSSSDS